MGVIAADGLNHCAGQILYSRHLSDAGNGGDDIRYEEILETITACCLDWALHRSLELKPSILDIRFEVIIAWYIIGMLPS